MAKKPAGEALREALSKIEKDDAAPTDTKPASTESVSKTDMIRRAIAAGYDKPSDGVAWIKTQYSEDVSPNMFSTIKTKEKTSNVHVVRTRSSTPTRPASSGTVDLELLEGVKSLIRRYGAEDVSKVVELLVD